MVWESGSLIARQSESLSVDTSATMELFPHQPENWTPLLWKKKKKNILKAASELPLDDGAGEAEQDQDGQQGEDPDEAAEDLDAAVPDGDSDGRDHPLRLPDLHGGNRAAISRDSNSQSDSGHSFLSFTSYLH